MLRGASKDIQEMLAQSTEVGVMICICIPEHRDNKLYVSGLAIQRIKMAVFS